MDGGSGDTRTDGDGSEDVPADRGRVGLPALALDDAVRPGRRQHRLPPLPRDASLPPRLPTPRLRLRPLRHPGVSHGRHVHAGLGLGVATWFAAAWQIMEGDGNVAPRALADELGVSYKTALRIKRKLEEALAPGSADADLLERLRRDAGGPGALAAGVPARDRSSRARENIRAAACRAFAARGPSATRIADIAREAGVSSAIIHYYYKSKDEVLLAALQWANEHTSRQLRRASAGDDGPDRAAASDHRPRDPLRGRAPRRVRALDRDLGAGTPASAPARRVRRDVGGLDQVLPAARRGRDGGRGVPPHRPGRRDRPAHGRALGRPELPLGDRLHEACRCSGCASCS